MRSPDFGDGTLPAADRPPPASEPRPPGHQGSAAHVDHELDIERRWLLLARIDPRQFIFFYEKYYDPIFRFVFHKTLDRDLTEELVSRTFFNALRKLWQFRWQGVSFGAWLYRIALNEVRAELRRYDLVESLERTCLDELPAAGPDALTQVIITEDQLRVRKCLELLGESERDILMLHYWEELNVTQIGVILNLPRGTVKSRLKRSRDKLRLLLVGRAADHQGARRDLMPRFRVIPGRRPTPGLGQPGRPSE
jgi:RNA polymerase sigma-70 factor (ECF subfamily)